MKKAFFTMLVTVIAITKAFSQVPDTLTCDHPDRDSADALQLPWFGNNDYLEDFLDSIGYGGPNMRIVGPDKVKYHVPIKFWVYRNSAGVGGPTMSQLQNYIYNLNIAYNVDNDTKIGFYMNCEIGYIDDDSHLEVGNLEGFGLVQDHKERGCINIHIADNVIGALGIHYRARLFGVDGIFLDKETYTETRFASTIAHEVGHYFELDHTHQFSTSISSCFKEPIDRNRTVPAFCSFASIFNSSVKLSQLTGDFLSDTPADHDLSANFACSYIFTGFTDPWGDHYETPPSGSLSPDPKNILSYNTAIGCINRFSRLQIAVMLHSIERGKSANNRNAWKDAKAEYDEYEMDNFNSVPRDINFGEKQERNFHQQYNEVGTVWTQCDVDWVSFVAPCSGTYNVTTSAMAGKTNANTRLTLFSNAMVQLAQNDDISGTNTFSSVQYSFVSGTTYLIRVENMGSQATSYYNLQVGPVFSITGADNPCANGGNQYSLSEAPPSGSTVTWSILPNNGSITLSPNGSTVTLNLANATPGSYTLTASISGTCYTGSVEKQITVSTPSPVGIILSNDDPLCINERAPRGIKDVWVANQVPGATYEWRVNGTVRGTNSPYLGIIHSYCVVGTNTVTCRIYLCGAWSAEVSNEFEAMWCEEEGFRSYSISPNPADAEITVTATENIVEVELTDNLGQSKFKKKYAKGTKMVKLPTTSFKAGIYVLRIYDGNRWHSKQLIIQR